MAFNKWSLPKPPRVPNVDAIYRADDLRMVERYEHDAEAAFQAASEEINGQLRALATTRPPRAGVDRRRAARRVAT